MTKFKALIRKTLCENIVIVEFPDGKWNTCHVSNVEWWLAGKEITPEETGKYGEDNV
jgi:hypothetical protein